MYDERYCQHDMLHQKIVASNVDLVVLGPVENDPGHLSCITKIDVPAHMRMVRKIQQDCKVFDAEKVLRPFKGEICLAKMPERGGYIRCKCLEDGSQLDGDDDLMVYAIDYGAVCRVPAHTLRVRLYNHIVYRNIFCNCFLIN